MMIENPEEVTAVLTKLSVLRVRLLFNDLVTGYSSLANLSRFRINTIKIDRSFIDKISLNFDTLHVVMAIVTLYQKTKRVAAEEIDTIDQLTLDEMRCNHGQGYLFSNSLDETAIVELIKSADSTNHCA